MKTKLLTICILIILSGCSEQQTVNYSDTYEKDGLIYLKFSEPTPYTGNITGEKKGSVKNGKKHLEFFTFYPSGKLFSKAKYDNGLRYGQYRKYCPNGDILEKGYYKNGIPKEKYSFFRCKSNENYSKYFMHRQDKYYSETRYNQENHFRLTNHYKENGQLSISTQYSSSDINRSLGRWHPDNILKNSSLIFDYYLNGNMSLRYVTRRGKKYGLYEKFWENGNSREKGHFYNGKKHGTFIWFNIDGNETQKKYYDNGKEKDSEIFYFYFSHPSWQENE